MPASSKETIKYDAAFGKPSFYHPDRGYEYGEEGLTKREYTAIHILQSLLANPMIMDNAINGIADGTVKDLESHFTSMAVEWTDALFEKLNK